MTLRKRIDPPKNCMSDQSAPKKKPYFPGNPISGLNRKTQKSKKANNHKSQKEIMALTGRSAYFVSASVGAHSHTLYPTERLL